MSQNSSNPQVPGKNEVSYHKAVRRYLDDLPKDALARASREIERLAEFGLNPEAVDVKFIERKLWELRVDNPKPNRLRMRYFFIFRDGIYCMLHAYNKQTNEAPRRHIDLALSRIDD